MSDDASMAIFEGKVAAPMTRRIMSLVRSVKAPYSLVSLIASAEGQDINDCSPIYPRGYDLLSLDGGSVSGLAADLSCGSGGIVVGTLIFSCCGASCIETGENASYDVLFCPADDL